MWRQKLSYILTASSYVLSGFFYSLHSLFLTRLKLKKKKNFRLFFYMSKGNKDKLHVLVEKTFSFEATGFLKNLRN